MMQHWIRSPEGQVKPASLHTWATWFEDSEEGWRVARDDITEDVFVSTVFLGIDHGFSDKGPLPVLWETMIFGGPHDQYQKRFTSESEALVGHEDAVELARMGSCFSEAC